MPYLELGYTMGSMTGITYKERGGWIAEVLISGSASEGNRQAAVNAGQDTYQQVYVSSPSLGFAVSLMSIEETAEGHLDTLQDGAGLDSLVQQPDTTEQSDWANFDLFYSIPMLEGTFGRPVVLELGGGFPWNIYGNFIIPASRWAQVETIFRWGSWTQWNIGAVGNMTDAFFARATYGIIGMPGLSLQLGLRL